MFRRSAVPPTAAGAVPVPLGRKLAFAAADLFGGGSFNIVNFLYPGFLALVVGIPAYWAGIVMMAARIWDAVTDPLMGFLSDATRSRLGKRRIHLVIAAPLVLLSLFLMFYPYAMASLAARIISVMLSYIFFSTAQTMVMIPYYALSSEIAADYVERARCNAVRLGFSIVSSIVCVAVPGLMVAGFTDPGDGYKAMSLTFGTAFMIAVLITGFFAKEQIQSPPRRARAGSRDFFAPLRLRPFRQYLVMTLCVQMTMAVMSGLFFFYTDFYIARDVTAAGGTSMLGTLAAALMFGMQVVALPVYLKLIPRLGKTWVYRFGAVGWIGTGLLLPAVPPGAPAFVIYLIAALMGFFISAPGMAHHTMFGDVADAGELMMGERAEGAFGGLTNLINKIAQAVGMSVVMAGLGLAGFVEKDPAGAVPVLSQPATAQAAVVAMMAAAPLVLMSIGALVSRRYRIDAAMQRRLLALNREKGREGFDADRQRTLSEL